MNILKKINRNAFNEKVIHRYLFERYYFGTSKQRRALLPEKYQGENINLIVPEDSAVEDAYRADLTIYFKGLDTGVPVEVKWNAKDLTKDNQIDYLKKMNGFLVILGDFEDIEHNGVDVVKINADDFSDWIGENISRLSRESLIYQAGNSKLTNSNQYWVVFLRGGKGAAYKNFHRMLGESSARPFWAFKQDRAALKNILEMQKGDTLVFIIGSSKGGGMGHSKSPNKQITVDNYFITKVKEPYYMALDNKQGLFFETGVKPINHRIWPHFIDFDIIKSYTDNEPLDFGKQEEYGEYFANSANYGGGTPVPITRHAFETLKDRLRKISPLSK